MNNILFYPFLSYYKSPVGAVKVNENINIKIKIIKSFEISNLLLHIYNDENVEIMTKPCLLDFSDDDNYQTYITKFSIDKPYLYWYYFSYCDCFGRHFIERTSDLGSEITDNEPNKFQLNVYEDFSHDFSWFRGKVMYQIYPDRFFVGGVRRLKKDGYNYEDYQEDVRYLPYNNVYCNDFYGGNIEGIIEKIPYLKDLGVGIIYLNPIFLSPTHHRYDTSDYLSIDDVVGTNASFKRLIKECKKEGIEVIIDGVYNHTGSDSIYFNKEKHFDEVGAYNSKDSKYYDWYKFISWPHKYESWWGIETLPRVNQKSSFVDFISGDKGVISHYMDMGIKGLRLDVVDELDSDFVRKINARIKNKDNNAITIGEVWEDATSKISYGKRRTYFDGYELDSVMNYPLRRAIIDYLLHGRLEHLVYLLREEVNNYSPNVLNNLMNLLSSHDVPRINSALSGVNFDSLSKSEMKNIEMTKSEYYKARSLVRMAYLMVYTLPGIPSLYYGDEVGMEGGRDPFNRRFMKWNPDQDPDLDLLSYFKSLGEMRNNLLPLEVLVSGNYKEEYFKDNVFIYNRFNDKAKIIIIINNSDYEYYYEISNATNLITKEKINGGTVVLSKTGVCLLVC